MEVIEYIKKNHKKYIGDNPNADYYNNKCIYEFTYYNMQNDENEIEYLYNNNIYDKYDDIIIDVDDYKYDYDEFGLNLKFSNNEIYIDNDFLIYFIDNYYKYTIYKTYLIFRCKKIIINFDYDLIQQKLINKNYDFVFIFYFQGNTIIFENGYFDCCKCKNFICNNEKITYEYLDYISCDTLTINNNLININEIYVNNIIINNSNNNYHSIINKLIYTNDNLNNLINLNKKYIIQKLILTKLILTDDNDNDNDNIINLIQFDNIEKINVYNDIILNDNINQLKINYDSKINFNNYRINKLIVNIYQSCDDIITYINELIQLLKNNPINKLIIKVSKYVDDIKVYLIHHDLTVDFQHIKLNKLKLSRYIKAINVNNIKKIKYI